MTKVIVGQLALFERGHEGRLTLLEGSAEPMSEHDGFCDIALRTDRGFRISAADRRIYWKQVMEDAGFGPEETSAYIVEIEVASNGWKGFWREGDAD